MHSLLVKKSLPILFLYLFILNRVKVLQYLSDTVFTRREI